MKKNYVLWLDGTKIEFGDRLDFVMFRWFFGYADGVLTIPEARMVEDFVSKVNNFEIKHKILPIQLIVRGHDESRIYQRWAGFVKSSLIRENVIILKNGIEVTVFKTKFWADICKDKRFLQENET